MRNYEKVLNKIQNDVKEYIKNNDIDSLVIGVSGGLDSAINSTILCKVCDELNIPLIGRYIHIESNKEDEQIRAIKIGQHFCSNFSTVDLTSLYTDSLMHIEESCPTTIEFKDKIRRGNIKARLRMIYLYNLAQTHHGIVVDNDNLTERNLGFWTLNGDVGDITPLSDLWKSEIYDFAKYIVRTLDTDDKKEALQLAIDATPTDGLGITSSDLDQIGAKSYKDVDDILMSYIYHPFKFTFKYRKIFNKNFGKDVVDKVISRHVNSNYKRNSPYVIKL